MAKVKDIFKEGTKRGVVFTTNNGALLINDLWSLPVDDTNEAKLTLLGIGRSLKAEINTVAGEKDDELSELVATKQSTDISTLELKYAIVKAIIKDKVKDEERQKKLAVDAANDKVILDLIAKKKLNSLESKDIKALEAMLSTNK